MTVGNDITLEWIWSINISFSSIKMAEKKLPFYISVDKCFIFQKYKVNTNVFVVVNSWYLCHNATTT